MFVIMRCLYDFIRRPVAWLKAAFRTLSDSALRNYFMRLNLVKYEDIPFVTKVEKDGTEMYFVAVLNERNSEISHCRLSSASYIDTTLRRFWGKYKVYAYYAKF